MKLKSTRPKPAPTTLVALRLTEPEHRKLLELARGFDGNKSEALRFCLHAVKGSTR